MTYTPKKGDIVNIYESSLTYVVTGETKTLYKCVSSGGFVVYKDAHEMRRDDDDDHRLAFIGGAQIAINSARAEVSEAQKLLELATNVQQ